MKKSDVRMEDINKWIIALYDMMDSDNLKLSRKDEDKLDKQLTTILEKFFNYPDYRCHN